jgi:hypothetical protein
VATALEYLVDALPVPVGPGLFRGTASAPPQGRSRTTSAQQTPDNHAGRFGNGGSAIANDYLHFRLGDLPGSVGRSQVEITGAINRRIEGRNEPMRFPRVLCNVVNGDEGRIYSACCCGDAHWM